MKPDAAEAEKAHAPATPGKVFGMSRRAQFTIFFIIVCGVLGIWLTGPFRAMFSKEDTSIDKAAPAVAAGFKLTPQQWASVGTATVKEMVFQPERQAEGKITVADDRTTSVFPPYSGRVTAVFVDEGARVEHGQPLFRMDSTDLVQAQNDVVAGTAAVENAQSQVTLTQTTEQRAHQSLLANVGALKDWQQAQADLATAQNRLRIILVQSGEPAPPASVPTRTSPNLTVPAPLNQALPPNLQPTIASSIPELAQFKKGLLDLGYNLQLSYTAEALGIPTGGVKQGATYEGLLAMAVDGDLDQIAGLSDATFHINAFVIHGRGLSKNNIFNFLTVTDIEALAGTRLYEVWFEQALFGGMASIRIGQFGRIRNSSSAILALCISTRHLAGRIYGRRTCRAADRTFLWRRPAFA